MSDVETNRDVARTALEEVCSRGDMTLAPQCYAEDFADYVDSLELLRQLGLWRTLPAAPALLRALRDGRASQ